MKGDGFINIKINIRGIYNIGDIQPHISIYDMNGCLVSKGYSKCGTYCACLNKCKRYRVVVKFLNKKVCQYIYTDRCNFNIYLNTCSINRRNSRTIIVQLKDYYYNLPISKGVLNFGQTSNNN